jgi:large subunit ribosomal protein L25
MAQSIVLNAKTREVTGKRVRAMRAAGRIPIIVYGSAIDPLALEVDTKAFIQVASEAGTTQVVSLKIEGEKSVRSAMIREVQQHVTRLTPIHADLVQVDLTQTIRAVVPIVISAFPKLAQAPGAIASTPITEVNVEALPGKLPQAFEVDASEIDDFDTSIRTGDLDLGEGVILLDDPEGVVFTMSRMRAEAVTDEEDVEAEEESEADRASELGGTPSEDESH